MRRQSSITSLSWIPSEAVEGSTRLAFESGLAHYDEPPPDVLEDVEALRAADRFRFTQTTGGRTGVPAPRRVRRRPFVQAAVEAHQLDRSALDKLSMGHRRPEPDRG